MKNPFVKPSVLSALELVAAIESRDDVLPKDKREMRGAWITVARCLGADLKELPAHPNYLRNRLAALSPGGLNVTRKRMHNVAWNIKRSMRLIKPAPGKSFKADYSAEAEAMRARISDRYLNAAVACILRLASARGVALTRIDDAFGAEVLSALRADSLNKRPEITHKNAIRAWNRVVASHPQLGLQPLKVPVYKAPSHILDAVEIPEPLKTALSQWLHRPTTIDPFDLKTPIVAWTPNTIATYDKLLRRYFGLLKRENVDLSTYTTLIDIANVELATVAFAGHGLRKSARGRISAANTIRLLIQICNEAAEGSTEDRKKELLGRAEALKILAERLRALGQKETRNRERLKPLRHDANLARLFPLPIALMREVEKLRHPSRAEVLLMQWAVALLILTFCPLRIDALARLRLDRHLTWAKPGMKGSLILEFTENELKNGEPASLPLPPECARVIRRYIQTHRRVLPGHAGPFLFPGEREDRSKGSATLGHQLQKIVWERTGLKVNAHLYRHIVHLIVLRRWPGAYAMVARVLTHRSISTTIKNYSYFDADLSTRAYQRLVRQVQAGVEIDGNHDDAVAYSNRENDYE
jgi:integrase